MTHHACMYHACMEPVLLSFARSIEPLRMHQPTHPCTPAKRFAALSLTVATGLNSRHVWRMEKQVCVCVCVSLHAGFMFGRTPLIKLSPKKTVEGFIGGALGTILIAYVLALVLSQCAWITCPRRVSV